MDLGLAVSSPRSPQTERRRSQSQHDLAALVLLIAKLALSTAMSPKMTRAIGLDKYQVSESSEYFAQGRKYTESYAEAAKTFGKDQKQQKIAAHAHPHVHVWNAWLMAAKKELAEKDLNPPQASNLDAYIAKKKNGSTDSKEYLHTLMKEVRYARCCKTYDNKIKRLEANVVTNCDSDICFQQVTVPLRIRSKAVKLEGVAPLGDLERRIQTAIDELDDQA
ncbi:unnamed protein product [Prorocentrum cordatum]|uniref:Uncharacterized protein n=1 Tax=Prorocentrum cordatum TaxID=2364126 RepID=A0ABN9PCS4_9DINO|nr:unnamed protein product [Polarella glacialis]